jgi:small subunit ribosomal protein S14
MARKALVIKHEKKREKFLAAKLAGVKPKMATKVTNRCKLCGRNGAYIRKFEICRICFRELAASGKLAGVTKSSW